MDCVPMGPAHKGANWEKHLRGKGEDWKGDDWKVPTAEQRGRRRRCAIEGEMMGEVDIVLNFFLKLFGKTTGIWRTWRTWRT